MEDPGTAKAAPRAIKLLGWALLFGGIYAFLYSTANAIVGELWKEEDAAFKFMLLWASSSLRGLIFTVPLSLIYWIKTRKREE
jgi:hypothetical protein